MKDYHFLHLTKKSLKLKKKNERKKIEKRKEKKEKEKNTKVCKWIKWHEKEIMGICFKLVVKGSIKDLEQWKASMQELRHNIFYPTFTLALHYKLNEVLHNLWWSARLHTGQRDETKHIRILY